MGSYLSLKRLHLNAIATHGSSIHLNVQLFSCKLLTSGLQFNVYKIP